MSIYGGVRGEVGGPESCRLNILAMAVHLEDTVEMVLYLYLYT